MTVAAIRDDKYSGRACWLQRHFAVVAREEQLVAAALDFQLAS